MNLASVAKYLIAILACQYISNTYFSMLEVWNQYTDLLILITVHKIYRWFITKKEDKAIEKENYRDKPEDILDSCIYKFAFVILISYVIEIVSGIYFAIEIIQTFKHFDEQGITSAKLFNGRCSGAYYYKYSCDQKKLAEELNSEDAIVKAFNGQIGHHTGYGDFYNMMFSGLNISCRPGHSKMVKEDIVKYNWDGPIPVHSENDCIKTDLFGKESWRPIYY